MVKIYQNYPELFKILRSIEEYNIKIIKARNEHSVDIALNIFPLINALLVN